MKLTRYTKRTLARLLLALALFAQGIVTAHACTPPAVNPAQAVAAMPEHESMPCHEDAAPEHAAPGANTCLNHCSQADQISVDQHDAPIAAPVGVMAWVSIQAQAQHRASAISPQQIAPDTGPPIPIRFCSLLN